MRSIGAMVVYLVALALVVMGMINPSPAMAAGKASVGAQAHASATDAQAALRATDAQVSQLQAKAAQYAGRLSALEARVSALESSPVPPPPPSLKPLKDKIRELEEKLGKVEEDLKTRPTREEFVALEKEVGKIAIYFDSENTGLYLPGRVSKLEDRVQRLEDEPKVGLVIGASALVIGHDAVSDLGVTRVGGGGGLTAGMAVETKELAVLMDGGIDWIGSGMGGTHWRVSAVGMSRRPRSGIAVGGGLAGQLTLLGVGGDAYYQSWGLGPELRLARQSWKVTEDRKVFVVLSARMAVPMGPVFSEGERLAALRPSLEIGLAATIKVGGRGPRRE
jgi:hypothetical protein